MKKNTKHVHRQQKQREQRPVVLPAEVVELTEQDLEQVQGATAIGGSGEPVSSSDSPLGHSIISPR